MVGGGSALDRLALLSTAIPDVAPTQTNQRAHMHKHTHANRYLPLSSALQASPNHWRTRPGPSDGSTNWVKKSPKKASASSSEAALETRVATTMRGRRPVCTSTAASIIAVRRPSETATRAARAPKTRPSSALPAAACAFCSPWRSAEELRVECGAVLSPIGRFEKNAWNPGERFVKSLTRAVGRMTNASM